MYVSPENIELFVILHPRHIDCHSDHFAARSLFALIYWHYTPPLCSNIKYVVVLFFVVLHIQESLFYIVWKQMLICGQNIHLYIYREKHVQALKASRRFESWLHLQSLSVFVFANHAEYLPVNTRHSKSSNSRVRSNDSNRRNITHWAPSMQITHDFEQIIDSAVLQYGRPEVDCQLSATK